MTEPSAHLEATNDNPLPFAELDLSPQLKKGIKELGYVTPTAFQRGVLEYFQKGKNVVGEGDSNYGKSLAFCLPILAKITVADAARPQALIVCENALQCDLLAKECKNLARHLDIAVGNASHLSKNEEDRPHVVIVSVEDLTRLNAEDLEPSLQTAFFDGLSRDSAHKAITLLAGPLARIQVLIFGKETIETFKSEAQNLMEDAIYISNNDQPKKTVPAKHIYHQAKDAEPKPRALLAAMELHRPKSALVTCNEAQEGELLARYLSRYGYKTAIVSEDNNRQGLRDALRDCQQGTIDVVICQNSLLLDVSLENIAFMLNYDMFDRPQTYEHKTQFNKQGLGVGRTIVNILTNRELGYLGPIKAQCLIDFTEMPLPNEEEVLSLSAARILDAMNKEASEVELEQFDRLATKIFLDPNAKPALSLLLRNYLTKQRPAPIASEFDGRDDRGRRNSRSFNDRRRPERSDRRERSSDRGERGDRGDRGGDRGERGGDRSERGDRAQRSDWDRDNQANREPSSEGASDEQGNSQSSGTSEGITRLYVTLGRRDGLNDLASLAQFLSDKSGVDLGHFSGSGMIRDTSAHIEVDDDVAEDIIKSLNDSPRPGVSEDGQGGEPIVCERARGMVQRPNRRPPMRRRRSNFQRR